MTNWYVLHTKAHKEVQVQHILANKGIETFLPVRPGAPQARSERSFFPCYLFARADLEIVGLTQLQYLPGNRGVVMFGDQPARVDDYTIVTLKERMAHLDGAGDLQGLVPGDRVRITAGPLAELEAVFDRRLSAAGRVRVLMELLHHWTTVELDSHAVTKTGALPPTGRVHALEPAHIGSLA